jgi:AraC-like DNA-binding protein/mannose-6-phosphate isomerase-like protein (cupin superfamily)
MPIVVEYQPMIASRTNPVPKRSINADDYQNLPVAVAVMQRHFPSNWTIPPHCHRRDQLLFAAVGTMRVRTETHSWLVPPQRAVYMPASVVHSVSIRAPLEMRTLYIEPESHPQLPNECVVITASPLLQELIKALLELPPVYDPDGRGGWLGRLILEEVCRGKALDLSIPMPTDPRLLRVCEAVIRDPGNQASLAAHCDIAGASERTLARLAQRQLGMSFSMWRQHVRFHYALEDLARGQAVAKVARDCGYASVSAFTAAFRKSLGHPPSRILDRISER